MTAEAREQLHRLITLIEADLYREGRAWVARDLRQVVALLYAAADTLDTLEMARPDPHLVTD